MKQFQKDVLLNPRITRVLGANEAGTAHIWRVDYYRPGDLDFSEGVVNPRYILFQRERDAKAFAERMRCEVQR